VPAAGLYTKVPGTLALASNWVELRAVPCRIAAGDAQDIKGTAWVTRSVTVAVAEEYDLVSLGVKVTESVCKPALSTAPADGEYEKAPGTLESAFN
jgi:hypothetical protein